MNGFDQALRIVVDNHKLVARCHLIFVILTAAPVLLAQWPVSFKIGACTGLFVLALSILHDCRGRRGLFAYCGVILDQQDRWRVLRTAQRGPGMIEDEARLVRCINWSFLIVLSLETDQGCRGSLWVPPSLVSDTDWRRLRARLRLL